MRKQNELTLMSAIFWALVIFIVVIFPETTAAGPPAFVPKTGQTESYAEDDDGDLQAGVDLPSPRFSDNGDGTVTDNLTRLIWLKNANCFGTRTWLDALSDVNELADGDCDLTDGSVPGDWRLPNKKELLSLIHYGYYAPALSDADGTGQWSEGDPFIRIIFGTPQSLYWYWTSTSIAHDPYPHAWAIALYNGWSGGASKTNYAYVHVWPVRGGRTFDTIE